MNNPEIGYFVYIKSRLELRISSEISFTVLPPTVRFEPQDDPLGLIREGNEFIDLDRGRQYHLPYRYRLFDEGDVVFFKNRGGILQDTPGSADVYVKSREIWKYLLHFEKQHLLHQTNGTCR